MTDRLQRFKDAQERNYSDALQEIRNGKKTSHWMWYIFPQLEGLGHSETAKYYAIPDQSFAKQFYEDEVLGKHLVEISTALLEHHDKSAETIFGFPDCLKLKSCMTLFALVCPGNPVFQRVLDQYYDGQMDMKTVALLKGTKACEN